MEIGLVTGMLFLWTVFMFHGLVQINRPEERYVRVEVDSEQVPFLVKDKQ